MKEELETEILPFCSPAGWSTLPRPGLQEALGKRQPHLMAGEKIRARGTEHTTFYPVPLQKKWHEWTPHTPTFPPHLPEQAKG